MAKILNTARKTVHKRCAAVVAAGGASIRMSGGNKLFAAVGGIPILAMTLCALQDSEYIDDIIVVVRGEDAEQAGRLCCDYNISKLFRIVSGGETRTSSVYNGVMAVPRETELIAIHDGCRPFVTNTIIGETVLIAAKYGAAAPGVPVKDTIKVAEHGIVKSTPVRSTLFAVQTPQVFDADLIKGALKNAMEKKLSLTDDCMAAEAVGVAVHLTDGSYENLKITTPADLVIGESILKMRGEKA
ncbi:MAG: 2-C-methyl-D-erythritol 4-phosphate cytidylyltransferase [Oscillospiraceae bacterium]